jgi:hypothetical protein
MEEEQEWERERRHCALYLRRATVCWQHRKRKDQLELTPLAIRLRSQRLRTSSQQSKIDCNHPTVETCQEYS